MKTPAFPLTNNATGWDHIPITERDPSMTCATCMHAVRERSHPADIKGTVFCKVGPKQVTSLPQAQGGVLGVAAYPQPLPHEWCAQWKARESGVESSILSS